LTIISIQFDQIFKILTFNWIYSLKYRSLNAHFFPTVPPTKLKMFCPPKPCRAKSLPMRRIACEQQEEVKKKYEEEKVKEEVEKKGRQRSRVVNNIMNTVIQEPTSRP